MRIKKPENKALLESFETKETNREDRLKTLSTVGVTYPITVGALATELAMLGENSGGRVLEDGGIVAWPAVATAGAISVFGPMVGDKVTDAVINRSEGKANRLEKHLAMNGGA